MKAEDTIMGGHYSPEEFQRLNRQAQISFKAGIMEVSKLIVGIVVGQDIATCAGNELKNQVSYILIPLLEWRRIVGNITYCLGVDECFKVKMIFDKDMLDFQYREAIKEVCGKCERRNETLIPKNL